MPSLLPGPQRSTHFSYIPKRNIITSRSFLSLVDPEAVLPEQLVPPPDLPPCGKLLLAILEDAIDCYYKGKNTPTPHSVVLARDAESWIRDPGIWLYSFNY